MATAQLTTPELPLRVALLWNGTVQAEDLIHEPRTIKLGKGRDALFALPEGVSEDDDITVLSPDGPAFALQPNAAMGGFLSLGGQRQPASALRGPQRLGPQDYGVITLGSVSSR